MSKTDAVARILALFEAPLNKRALPDATFVTDNGVGRDGCHDRITLYARISPDGVIDEITYEGDLCTISTAAASLVTERLRGRSVADALAMPFDTLIDDLGREVVQSRVMCATLPLNTLKNGLRQHVSGAPQAPHRA